MGIRIGGLSLFIALMLCFLCPARPAFAEDYADNAAGEGFVMPATDKFIKQWERSGGSELGASQAFIEGLCEILGVEKPRSPQANLPDNDYVFEKAVALSGADGGGTGRIDCYKRGHFIWESKQGSDKPGPDEQGPRRIGTAVRGTATWDRRMAEARAQGENYARNLPGEEGHPPFLLVSDIGHSIEVYSDFKNTGNYIPFPAAGEHRILLQDLHKPEILERLRLIWTDPLSLDPSRESERVTRDIAVKLSELAKSLEDSGHDPEAVSMFLTRCVFTLYSEDVGLLPHDSFQKLLVRLENRPAEFAAAATDLWAAMKDGGESVSLGQKVLRFQGYLFQDTAAMPLNKAQLALLLEASEANWAAVDSSIFGTLLLMALTPEERHRLGAHYTPPSYVERLVVPAVIEPLKAEWEAVAESAMSDVAERDFEAAKAKIAAFHQRLSTVVVLDSSCGSGNFLTVTMNLLKDLEGEVVQALRDLGKLPREFAGDGYAVSPQQFRGIEAVPRAAAVSELLLQLAYLQRHFKIHGGVNPPEPILREDRSVECRDAVLAWDGDTPRQADPWPDCEFIVGNPPFIGNHKMRSALGDKYVDALFKVYPSFLRGSDYVMFWWHRSAELVRQGKVKRFGLITTNSLGQPRSRKVVEHHMAASPPLTLLWAVPDHPWINSADGAQVRIAMTVGGLENSPGVLAKVILAEETQSLATEGQSVVYLDSRAGVINANLTIGPDVGKARPLAANLGVAGPGVKLHGNGFLVTPEQAAALGLGKINGLEQHIRRYVNGRDLAGKPRALMVIDLYGLSIEEVGRRYPEIYKHLVQNVKPERDKNRNAAIKANWWLFGRTKSEFRLALEGLSRYIATPETAKFRYFIFLDPTTLADGSVISFAFDDAYVLGVLSSRTHVLWALASGGRMASGNTPRYNKSICFDTFPFPNASEAQKERIRGIAERIDAHRKTRQALFPSLTLTDLYAVLDQLHYGVDLTPPELRISEQGDATALKALHDELDAAVAEAYGWPADLEKEDVIANLLELNQRRAAEEKAGTAILWLRPEYQAPAVKTEMQGKLL